MSDDDILILAPKPDGTLDKETQERLKKLLPSFVDFTYSDTDEGVRRVKLLINIVICHIFNISYIQNKHDSSLDRRRSLKDENYLKLNHLFSVTTLSNIILSHYLDMLDKTLIFQDEGVIT